MEIHEGHLFQHGGIVDGLSGITAPGEGSVAVDQNCRNLGGILVRKGFHNDVAGLLLIGPGDFRRSHLPSAGDFTVEVVALSGYQGLNAEACLGEGGGPAGMGVDDAAAVGERPI